MSVKIQICIYGKTQRLGCRNYFCIPNFKYLLGLISSVFYIYVIEFEEDQNL